MIAYKKDSLRKMDKLKYYFLVFFSIYFNTSSLAVSTRMSYEKYLIIALFSAVVIFICKLVRNNTFKINQEAMLTLIISIILITLTMITKQDFSILNFVIITQLFIAFLYVHFLSFDDFVKAYVKIVLYLSIFSLGVMYVIIPFFNNVAHIFPIRYNSAGLALRDFIFGFHFENHIVASKRNTGIFREMGVYQHFLNLALLFYLFYLKEDKLIVILIFSITVLSTFSTPGIIFLFIILGTYLYENISDRKIKVLKIALLFLLIIIFLSQIIPNSFHYIEQSMNKLLGRSGSYYGRIGAIKGNILSWLQSPILGNGIEKGLLFSEELYLGQLTEHNTSTTTSFMAIYGLLYAIILSMPLILIIYSLKIKRLSKSLIIIALFMSLNTQRYIYDQFYYILVFSYFMKRDYNEKYKKNNI
jgi:hypothetical protein